MFAARKEANRNVFGAIFVKKKKKHHYNLRPTLFKQIETRRKQNQNKNSPEKVATDNSRG